MLIRPEENALLLWNDKTAGTAWLSGKEMDALGTWAEGGSETAFIRHLLDLKLISPKQRTAVSAAVHIAAARKSPPRSFYAPESLHIELTTVCPLHCPQCYKGQAGQQELSYPLLSGLLRQAAELQILQIALGGGEPLMYSGLYKAVSEITALGMSCSVTTGGTGLDADVLNRLISCGLKHIQVSLNGSTEQVNSLSRDGFHAATDALALLSGSRLSFGINWVAREDNLDDLPSLLRLAEQYGAGNVNVLRCKPSPSEDYAKVRLTAESQRKLAAILSGSYRLSVKTDSAYSGLLCSLNGQPGGFSGCGAGRRFMAVDAGGNFKPCSHVPMSEPADRIADYWFHSPQLSLFRGTEDKTAEPCRSCRYLSGCRGCRAIVLADTGDFYAGEKDCAYGSIMHGQTREKQL